MIRYGPNRLLTIDPADFQSLCQSPSKFHSVDQSFTDVYGYGKPFRKAQSYATMVPWAGGETTTTAINKQLHKSLRHDFTSGLSASSLKQYEPAVMRNLGVYFQKMLEGSRVNYGWSQAKDMNLWSMEPVAQNLRVLIDGKAKINAYPSTLWPTSVLARGSDS